jgi:hypothetical protein
MMSRGLVVAKKIVAVQMIEVSLLTYFAPAGVVKSIEVWYQVKLLITNNAF